MRREHADHLRDAAGVVTDGPCMERARKGDREGRGGVTEGA